MRMHWYDPNESSGEFNNPIYWFKGDGVEAPGFAAQPAGRAPQDGDECFIWELAGTDGNLPAGFAYSGSEPPTFRLKTFDCSHATATNIAFISAQITIDAGGYLNLEHESGQKFAWTGKMEPTASGRGHFSSTNDDTVLYNFTFLGFGENTAVTLHDCSFVGSTEHALTPFSLADVEIRGSARFLGGPMSVDLLAFPQSVPIHIEASVALLQNCAGWPTLVIHDTGTVFADFSAWSSLETIPAFSSDDETPICAVILNSSDYNVIIDREIDLASIDYECPVWVGKVRTCVDGAPIVAPVLQQSFTALNSPLAPGAIVSIPDTAMDKTVAIETDNRGANGIVPHVTVFPMNRTRYFGVPALPATGTSESLALVPDSVDHYYRTAEEPSGGSNNMYYYAKPRARFMLVGLDSQEDPEGIVNLHILTGR